MLEFIGVLCESINLAFHVLPDSGSGLFVCFHITQKVDSYSIISLILNKFKALVLD